MKMAPICKTKNKKHGSYSPEHAFVFNLEINNKRLPLVSTLLGLIGNDKVYSIYQDVS